MSPKSDRVVLIVVLVLLFGGGLLVVGAVAAAGLFAFRAVDQAPPPEQPAVEPAVVAQAPPERKTEPDPKPQPKPEPVPKVKLAFPAVTPVVRQPAPLAADRVELNLPGKVTETCVGGGGRYWILKLGHLRHLAVFDANAAKVVKFLPLANDSVRFAAGMNVLITADPATGELTRYDLATFAKTLSAPLPFPGDIKRIAMGSASAGPILLHFAIGPGELGEARIALLDIAFREIDLGKDVIATGLGGRTSRRDDCSFRFSPDGRTIGSWTNGVSPSGLNVTVLAEAGIRSKYEHESAGSVLPTDHGVIHTGLARYTPDLKVIGTPPKDRHAIHQRVPAQQGEWSVLITPVDLRDPKQRTACKITFHAPGEDRPLHTITAAGFEYGRNLADLPYDSRLFFSPESKLFAVLNPGDDAIALHRFDIPTVLSTAEFDYLLMAAPAAAEPGAAYRHKLDVKSKAGGVKLTLDAGPKGMTLQGDSLVWNVPADWTGPDDVILTVTDAGNEKVNSFKLVRRRTEAAVEPVPPTATAPQPPVVPPRPKPGTIVAIPPPVNPFPITPTKAADGASIKLPGYVDSTAVAGGGRFALLRMPKVKQVAVIDLCEGKIAKQIPIPDEGTNLAGGQSHLVLHAPGTNTFERWSLTTFEKEASVANPLPGKVHQILMGHATDGPLMVVGPNKLLDAKTFREVPTPPGAPAMDGLVPPRAAVSADGRQYVWWYRGQGGPGVDSLLLRESGAKSHHSQYRGFWSLQPGWDGLISADNGFFTSDLKSLFEPHIEGRDLTMLPAVEGPLYVQITGRQLPGARYERDISLRAVGEKRNLAGLGTPDGFFTTAIVPYQRLMFLDRVFFVPRAKTLMVLAPTEDTVVFNALDVDALLAKSATDHLFVANRPGAAERGVKFTHAPEVKSKKGGVTLKLESGPEGMTVQGDAIVWPVPPEFPASEVFVILRLTDASGQEAYRPMSIEVK